MHLIIKIINACVTYVEDWLNHATAQAFGHFIVFQVKLKYNEKKCLSIFRETIIINDERGSGQNLLSLNS
jgi:hypothetical protein